MSEVIMNSTTTQQQPTVVVNTTTTTVGGSSATTLPPRKRAKTQEEKEQRRIERILRNRRAAHASREKKRRHVELLETHVKELDEIINCYRQRESILLEHSSKKQQAADLPALPTVSIETSSLLEQNKRSMKKLKSTPKPRPIVLKRESGDHDDADDSEGSDQDSEDVEDEDMSEAEEPQPQQKRQKKSQQQQQSKVKQEYDDSLLKIPTTEPNTNTNTNTNTNNVYLSPPISNIDSTSPSNLSIELNQLDNNKTQYYKSNPLFSTDELDDVLNVQDSNDLFFSTNLQITTSPYPDSTNSYEEELEQEQEQEELNPVLTSNIKINFDNSHNHITSGDIKSMHHPAVMMKWWGFIIIDFNLSHTSTSISISTEYTPRLELDSGYKRTQQTITRMNEWPKDMSYLSIYPIIVLRRKRSAAPFNNSTTGNGNGNGIGSSGLSLFELDDFILVDE